MIKSSQARAVGRQMIRDNKKLMIGTYFAYIGLAVAISMVDFLFRENYGLMMLWSIASIFLSLPLALGILHVNNMVYYKRPCSVNNLFDFFRNYHVTIKVIGVSVIYYLMLLAILFPLMMLTLFPIIFASIADTLSGYGAVMSSMVFLLFLLLIVTLFIGLIFSSFCSATYFIALRNRSITFGKLLTSSMKVGWKYVWKYTVFQLSFFGWVFLCMAPAILFSIAGIVAAEFNPYMWGFSSTIIIAGFIVTFLCVSLLSIYINAATAVFFNTAIDEYEQTHPNHPGFTPLHVPQQGSYRPASPSAQAPSTESFMPPPPSFPDAAPPQAPAQDTPAAPGPDTGDAPSPFASQGVDSVPRQEPQPQADADGRTDADPSVDAPPRVEAEPIAPADNACEVVLTDPGLGRILVAQRIADLTGVSIEAAREMANQAPHTIARGLSRQNAHELARALTDLGAQVEIR